MILNSDQDYITTEAVNWYRNSSSTLFQIDGEAGTGKSVVLNAIVERLGLKQNEVLPMAYTGQAAIVMRTKGLMQAVTCHSGLFDFVMEPVVDKATGLTLMDKQFNVPIVRKMFFPKNFKAYNSPVKLLIIDEGWMVPYSFRKHIENTGIKTIVAGDTGQLPPVEEHPAYFIDGNVYHLSQLMRQAETNPIVYLARRARRGLPIFPGLYGANVFVCYDDEVNNDILRNANIVVCGRNATREDINNTVRREIIHTDSDVPIFGERMICKKNNWELAVNGISLANGLVGTVVRPPKVSNYDGKCFTMDFLPDLLNVPFIDVRCDYQFLNAPFKEKQMIKMSKYSVGEKFDYAYASTVHSCQGSEFMNGIYIEESLPNHGIQQNLDYTAITRFRNSLIYVKKRPKVYYPGF